MNLSMEKKEMVDLERYLEKADKEEEISVEEAMELFVEAGSISHYEEEVYSVLIKQLQRIEKEKGIEKCIEVLVGTLKEAPKKEAEYAQINSVLEVIISKAKKYEDKWNSKRSEEKEEKKEKKEGSFQEKIERRKSQETTKDKILPLESSVEAQKPPVMIIRPGMLTVRKLSRMKRELKTKGEKIERSIEEGKSLEKECASAQKEFLGTGTKEFLFLLMSVAENISIPKLFSGEWEDFVSPNLQIDFLGLLYTYMEMLLFFLIATEGKIEEEEKIKSLSQKHYQAFLAQLALPSIEELETEIVVCLTLSMCVSLILRGKALTDCFALFSQEGKALLPDRNIFGIQAAVLRVLGLLYQQEKSETLLDIIFSLFNTQCLETYTVLQRRNIIECAVETLTRSVEPEKTFRLIKRIMYTYESAAQYSESTAQMISNFLSYIRTKKRENIREINSLYTRIIARSLNKIDHIEPYCRFLAAHDIEMPLHHLVRRYDPQFIATLYSTYFRHPFTLEKGTKAVGDFINFVNLSENLNYIYIMNMVPFIPSSPFIVHKLFLIYKRVYANASAFPRGIDTELFLLRMKTPALIGIAGFIFSDPKPLMRKKDIRKMGAFLGLPKNLSEDYILFLQIMYSVEKAKLENYNSKGVLSYLKDEITLKYLGAHIPHILRMVHREANIESKEFIRVYVCELLKIATETTAYPLSLIIIVECVGILFKKEESIAYSEEMHVRFRECFDTFRLRDFCMYKINPTIQMYSDLYSVILERLKTQAPEAYNYIVLNVVDLGLFHALPVMHDERGIKELLDRSNLIMKAIREFPTSTFHGTEIWDWIYFLCIGRPQVKNGASSWESQKVSPSEKEYTNLLYLISTGWINDLITIRGETAGIIENIRNYLRWILTEEYSITTLMLLLKVSSREERKELLKKAVFRGYSIKEEPETYYELFKCAKGIFYEYPLTQIYNFLSALNKSKKLLKIREVKEQELYELEIDELVFLSTEYSLKKVEAVLRKKQIVNCCGFFLNINDLSILEALSVIVNSEDEQEIEKAINRIEKEEDREKLLFYTPQIVQILKKSFRKSGEQIKIALLSSVQRKIAHSIIWEIRAHGDPNLKQYEEMLLKEMGGETKEKYKKVSSFLQTFTEISGKLKQYVSLEREKKKKLINSELSKASFPEGCYLPITGETVVRLVEGSGTPLQSAEKVPYMVTFKVNPQGRNELVDRAVIFKFGDDCRQDVLALQIIQIFKDVFKEKEISIYLYPYKVLATGEGRGIIEVIPRATSRDQIGRERVNNLVDYFGLKYGYREGHKYTEAIKNFVESFAGYSLVTYILNIKDRHNGNIMITDDGHLIHIDFGFIFDISPGNINIESPIKITDEIFSLLGGGDGPAFTLYKDLMVKGFYLLRKRAKDIVLITDLGKYSGLPCFTPATLTNLISRFRLDLRDDEVPMFVEKLIASSTKKLRTWIYDQYQHFTNNIAF
ncbi:phosphatidylinositol 4-kinase A [Nematocida sp. LUAm3]|nr:phosphatidylinositol 4-kinase A [Nematocida sp. LUAm3]KAI5176076.1 phosphatidylinositol 4-kinase A [Nematocida sp. LUAm2]KAI5177120.1 phosphatidylinositol 4-kinase A [Nematocida sp. LUAm1]